MHADERADRRLENQQSRHHLPRRTAAVAALADGGARRATADGRWQNFPTDLPHFLSYFVAHEAHHCGQLIMLARQLGHRLPAETVNGLWQWIALRRKAAATAR